VRVAALFDIHGNLPALDAVLEDVEHESVDAIVVGGDFTAGPFPNETTARLRALGDRVRFIRGNCERELLEGADDPVISRTPPLDDETREFITDLPLTLTVDVDELGMTLFCHATPHSDEEIITRDTSDERAAAALGRVDARAVVCGHTHVQYDRTVGNLRLVNSGSVGMPFEHEPGAYWLLLGPDVEHRRTAYDADAFAEAAVAAGFERWPRLTPDEAVAFMESLAAERGER
jgi:putative phosphoesterase